MNDQALIDRANKAKALIDSPIYQEGFENCRAAIIRAIELTPLSNTESAEDLRRCLKLLRDVRANLETAIKQGQLPAFRLAEAENRRKNPLRGIFGRKHIA